ncbi:TIGR03745 family integrating conjugative element membrane protein, partial [Pseudomonas aeruginosa]|uniref:TIGR03745 family integrating conjugative element membrane protein n=1 Tax=Pseudomonas aeruginosa TaxID=287 RepID=UPI003459E6CB
MSGAQTSAFQAAAGFPPSAGEGLFILALPGVALAALPKPEAPSRGEGSGIMQTIQNFGYDGAMLLALLICVAVFL